MLNEAIGFVRYKPFTWCHYRRLRRTLPSSQDCPSHQPYILLQGNKYNAIFQSSFPVTLIIFPKFQMSVRLSCRGLSPSPSSPAPPASSSILHLGSTRIHTTLSKLLHLQTYPCLPFLRHIHHSLQQQLTAGQVVRYQGRVRPLATRISTSPDLPLRTPCQVQPRRCQAWHCEIAYQRREHPCQEHVKWAG